MRMAIYLTAVRTAVVEGPWAMVAADAIVMTMVVTATRVAVIVVNVIVVTVVVTMVVRFDWLSFGCLQMTHATKLPTLF